MQGRDYDPGGKGETLEQQVNYTNAELHVNDIHYLLSFH